MKIIIVYEYSIFHTRNTEKSFCEIVKEIIKNAIFSHYKVVHEKAAVYK